MLGLIEDRADGIRLTERGRALAAAPSETSQASAKDLQQHASRPVTGVAAGSGSASLSILRNWGRRYRPTASPRTAPPASGRAYQ